MSTINRIRIAITTGGSRGDVQPYLALGPRLKAEGHKVSIAAHPYFEGDIQDAGLMFHAVRSVHPREETRAVARSGSNFGRAMTAFTALAGLNFKNMLEDLLEACKDADVVIYSALGFLGHPVVERLGLPKVGTGALLRAGVPGVGVPFFGDQLFWTRRMAALGTATSPISDRRLTAERLARAIERATTDERMKENARLLGEKIRGEDGLGRAVEAFYHYVAEQR